MVVITGNAATRMRVPALAIFAKLSFSDRAIFSQLKLAGISGVGATNSPA
ncbi:hypothetical protein AB8Z38_06545 [Bradyrhizobium sp. LLZ17]|uniref:Uncharacterized protein n=1 Tax=Bradyrhizobium sp. LLZ17 TaxID=3239388 RepID=A0AB39XNR2_9BRAD